MGFMFCDLHVSLNNPSSGDINSSNLLRFVISDLDAELLAKFINRGQKTHYCGKS